MFGLLKFAGDHFRTSLDTYSGICSNLQDYLIQGKMPPDLPLELSSLLDNEFTLILSYEQKLRQVLTTIGHARNYCTRASPIRKLPSEILTRIFHLVSANPCHLSPRAFPAGIAHYKDPTPYPDWLAQVCSRWRKVALSSPSLWTHIDLTTHVPLGYGLFDRAQAYIQRSNRVPLEIHLDDKGCAGNIRYHVDTTVSCIASRAKALEFIITADEIQPFHSSVLQAIVSRCSPKTFKTLRVHSDVSLGNPLITGRDPNTGISEDADLGLNPPPNALWCSESEMDHRLSGVSILHLQGVFFNWFSKLYHSLVDLRLTSPLEGNSPSILSSSLISILLGSPALKILHFSLKLVITDAQGDESMHDHRAEPVLLRDLEVVQVSTIRARADRRSSFHVGSLLQLLAPGSKPLRLTLETTGHVNDPELDSDGTKAFFSRSRVEKLCIKKGKMVVDQLSLCHLPNLKVLVLDSGSLWLDGIPNLTSGSYTWIIHDSSLQLIQLHLLAKLCHTGLVLSQIRVFGPLMGFESVPEVVLQAVFPTVHFPAGDSSRSHPTANWDIVD